MQAYRSPAGLVACVLLGAITVALSVGSGCPGTGDPFGLGSSSSTGGSSSATPWPSIRTPLTIDGDVGEPIVLSAKVRDARAPVFVVIEAEDGWRTETYADPDTGEVVATHAFDKPGGYSVSFKVTDWNGRKASGYTAVFIRDPGTRKFKLTVVCVGEGSVSPASGEYAANASVTLTATAKTGWRFGHWEGGLSGNANPATLVMDGDKAVTAVFEKKPHLQIHTEGEGSVTYKIGEKDRVTLTAVPAAGWKFDHWEGALGGNANPAVLVVVGDMEVTAVFVENGDGTDDGTGDGGNGDGTDGGGGGGGTGDGDYPRCYTGWATWTVSENGGTNTEVVRGKLYVPRAFMPCAGGSLDEWDAAYFWAEPTSLYVMREGDNWCHVGLENDMLCVYSPTSTRNDTDIQGRYDANSAGAVFSFSVPTTGSWYGPIVDVTLEFDLTREPDVSQCDQIASGP